jgi:RHH-type proline utilization regulon transcriptional repressor/proline dehydrogenase/delta 1-pyrroline-5-carboxylate dehydrogenase
LRELSLLPVLADMLQVPFGIAVRGQLPDCRGIGLIRSSARIGAGNRLSPPRHRFPSCPQPESPHIVSDILSPELPAQSDPARARITAAWSRDETEAVNDLLGQASLGPVEREQVLTRAADLVGKVRAKSDKQSAVESFMREYDLSSEEGVLLMCVAEALLRVPDAETADKLIRDKLGDANWKKHVGASESLFVNASTWGLMLTGRLVQLAEETRTNFTGALRRLVGRAGEPVIRLAVRQAMRIMGHQFVMGRTIEEAQDRAAQKDNAAYRYSYDMLGEAALTEADAARYMQAYRDAIRALGKRGPWKMSSTRPPSPSSCPLSIRATTSPTAHACMPS